MVSDYIHAKGRTSMNHWQINAIVRSVLTHRTMVSHDDLSKIEAEILRKETGLPGNTVCRIYSGTNQSPKNLDVRRSIGDRRGSVSANERNDDRNS